MVSEANARYKIYCGRCDRGRALRLWQLVCVCVCAKRYTCTMHRHLNECTKILPFRSYAAGRKTQGTLIIVHNFNLQSYLIRCDVRQSINISPFPCCIHTNTSIRDFHIHKTRVPSTRMQRINLIFTWIPIYYLENLNSLIVSAYKSEKLDGRIYGIHNP